MITMRSVVLLAVAGLTMSFSAAKAEEFTFSIRNSHPNALEVELYSQDRNHVWPGHGEVYIFDDGETKEIPLTCKAGETICYGAWISGDRETYWGVGPDNKEDCTDCCYTCEGGKGETVDLVE